MMKWKFSESELPTDGQEIDIYLNFERYINCVAKQVNQDGDLFIEVEISKRNNPHWTNEWDTICNLDIGRQYHWMVIELPTTQS